MGDKLRDQLWELVEKIIEYLPNLLAGLVLVVVGWFLGWVAKRVIIQIAMFLRLERFLTRFRWGQDFSKADIRHGLYNFLGNIAFAVTFLIFLDNALRVWKFTLLSNLLEKAIYFFPKLILAVTIFGVGWLIASWASRTTVKALNREKVPRAPLIGSFFKSVLIVLFSTMALIELDVAREVVMIGFITIFVTSGLMMVVLAAVSGKDVIQKIKKSLEEK
jgi:hypothetical protein